MGMDKRLQCLVGLTWWNLLQCTWGEPEWPASCKPAATYFRTISSGRNISGQSHRVDGKSEKSFPRNLFPLRQILMKCWGVVVGALWLWHCAAAKKNALHLTPAHSKLCTCVHYTLHLTPWMHIVQFDTVQQQKRSTALHLTPCLHLVHSGNRSLHTAQCTQHIDQYTLHLTPWMHIVHIVHYPD